MKKYLKVGSFGFLLWLIPFAVSVLIFPLRAMQRPLFESIMPVVITTWTVFFCILYFMSIKEGFQKEGILIGVVWLCMSIIFDLMLFMEGPMKMPLLEYTEDIAITYLMIPAITIGFGYLLDYTKRKILAEKV
ncbi:MAG: hypothetical protein EHM14_05980 [Methanothrix sp.]|nr:MAG: hypothetical protein EHM14_05980 [Methanothrix sp.]